MERQLLFADASVFVHTAFFCQGHHKAHQHCQCCSSAPCHLLTPFVSNPAKDAARETFQVPLKAGAGACRCWRGRGRGREGHDNGAWRFISRMPRGAPELQGGNKKPPASSVVSRRCRRPRLGDQRASPLLLHRRPGFSGTNRCRKTHRSARK